MYTQAQGSERLIRIHFSPGAYDRAASYADVSTTYWPWPTLDVLRPQLDIPVINTGRQYNLPPEPYGIVFNDMEGLHALADERGQIMLTSGIEMPLVVYRGQTQEHLPCLPSLARLTRLEEQLLALCRCVAFEDAIGSHPFVQISEQARLFDAPLYIDKEGMAQHYGLSTNLLDATNNFDVASFFATCHWDNNSRSYQPVKFAAQPGVLYRLTPAFFVGMHDSAEFRHVGWQPLYRPEQQRACALRVKKGHDFAQLPTVQKVRFRQSAKVSYRIWKSFDEGRTLFPKDAAAELADQAKRIMVFTRAQLDQAWIRLDDWHGIVTNTGQRQRVEKDAALEIAAIPILSWDGLDVIRDENQMRSQLQGILEKVRYRLAAYA